MDAPFKKSKKTEIGVDMTPGYAKRKMEMPQTPLKPVDLMKGVGRGRRSAPRPSEVSAPEPAPKVKPMPRTNASKPSSVPKVQKTNSQTPAKAKGKKFVYAAARNCIVKVDYRNYQKGKGSAAGNTNLVSARLAPFMKQNGGTTVGAQVGYIRREEAMEGALFTVRGNSFIAYNGAEAIYLFGDDPTMTVILSPEDPGADLTELTKRFMKDIYNNHVEEPPRFWCAAVHGNTDHKHVHIILSTIGENGKDARIDSGYVHSGRLQTDVSNILTEIQGSRTWNETLKANKRKRNALLLTHLDEIMFKHIEMQEDGTGKFLLKSLEEPEKKNAGKKSKKTLKESVGRRLQTLKSAGLVYNTDDRSGTWFFKPGSFAKLRRADYAEIFGLAEAEINSMIIDSELTGAYSGTIIESAEKDEKNMLFMIKDDEGKIHLRREYVKEAEDKERLTKLDSVSIGAFKKGYMGKIQGRSK